MSIVARPRRARAAVRHRRRRGPAGLRRRPGLPRALRRERPARRGPGARRPATATSCTSASGTAPCQRRHQKLVEEAPGRRPGAGAARGDPRRGGAPSPARSATTAPAPSSSSTTSTARLRLPGVQRPHPGRAPGHRDGHRHRPRRASSCASPRASRSRSRRTTSRSPGTPSSAGITAEAPDAGLPARRRARSTHWQRPQAAGIRVDSHCQPGYVVTPYYDSLLAKYRRTRRPAPTRARR